MAPAVMSPRRSVTPTGHRLDLAGVATMLGAMHASLEGRRDGDFRYTSYRHDEGGRLVRLTHPDNAAFGYGYDSLGRMTLVHDNAGVAAPTIT